MQRSARGQCCPHARGLGTGGRPGAGLRCRGEGALCGHEARSRGAVPMPGVRAPAPRSCNVLPGTVALSQILHAVYRWTGIVTPIFVACPWQRLCRAANGFTQVPIIGISRAALQPGSFRLTGSSRLHLPACMRCNQQDCECRRSSALIALGLLSGTHWSVHLEGHCDCTDT